MKTVWSAVLTRTASSARRGTRTDASGAVVEEDRPGDLAARGAMARVLDERIRERNRMRDDDQAQFVLADPGVRAAAQAAATGGPDAMAAYVTATTAAQARIGVPEHEQRILSRAQAQAIAGQIMRADPADGTAEAPDGPALRLRAIQRTYGDAWPRVMNDLVRDGNLSPDYQVLASIPSAVGQADFARMMTAARTAGGVPQFREAVRRAAPAEEARLTREVGTYLAPFARTATASGQSGGDRLVGVVGSSIENLAAYYVMRGLSAGDALQRATDRVLNDKYEFQGTMRVPKTLENGQPLGLRPVRQAQTQIMANLTPEALADVAGAQDVPAATRRETVWRAAQNGFWVPNERDSGLVLMMELQNGGRLPVRLVGGGRVELFFDNLPRPTIEGAATPQRDSPARGVTRIEGFDEPATPGTTPPAATVPAPAQSVLPGDRRGRSGTQPRGTWMPPQ